MKLKVKLFLVLLASVACIVLGVLGIVVSYISRPAEGLDPSFLIPTFLLIIGVLSVVNLIRGIREGDNKRQ